MKKLVWTIAAIVAAALIIASTKSPAQTLPLDLGGNKAPQGLCDPGEKLVFGCSLTTGKQFSLCSSQVLNKRSGYLRYRFGSIGNIEVNYPTEKAKPQFFFKYARLARFQTHNIHIRFQYGEDRFEVFDETKTLAGIDKRRTGVRATEGGANVYSTEHLCLGAPTGSLRNLEALLPEDTK